MSTVTSQSSAGAQLYDTDFYGWIQEQAARLRSRDFDALDLGNLIEEIEDMGKGAQREIESRLVVLLVHLLKWRFQPERRSASWELTIEEQRKRITRRLKKNPSLKIFVPEIYEDAYDYAVLNAAKETGLHRSVFPAQCPWTFEQATDEGFWP